MAQLVLSVDGDSVEIFIPGQGSSLQCSHKQFTLDGSLDILVVKDHFYVLNILAQIRCAVVGINLGRFL
jgi:hypothetical protein